MFENQISNLGNFQGVQLETDISVITLDDNINHTYCSKIKWEQDNRLPIGTARLTMPYSDDIAMYWIKYSGAVIVHANLNSHPRSLTQAMMSNFPATTSLNLKNVLTEDVTAEKDEKTNKIHFKNDKYNYSFIGKVYRFKQVGKTFIVYLEDLGWKFLQKVPKEFRETYIAGQTLDNAFQAICEFMGVDFAYSIQDLSEYSFSSVGYSVEKDGKIIEDTPTILKEWAADKKEDEEEEKNEDETMADSLEAAGAQLSGLKEYNNKQKKIQTTQKSDTLNQQVTNQDGSQVEDSTIKDEEQNTPNDKILQYQQEFDEKIKDLFIGNTLYDSNISDPILNYNWITVVPQSPKAETTTTPTDLANQENNNQENNNQENNQQNQEATT